MDINPNKMYPLWAILANVMYIILVIPATAFIRPKITKMEIESNIRFRLATTTIRMEVNNTEKKAKVFYFEVLLPNGAVVFDLHLKVNGTLFKGHKRNKSKEYRSWKGETRKLRKSLRSKTFFDIHVFAMNATLAGQSEAFFNLTYKTLLLRKDDVYTHRIPIFLRQNLVIKQFRVLVSIWEPRNFTKFTASLIKEKNMPDIENDTDIYAYPRTLWKNRNNILLNYTKKLGKLRNVFSRVFQVKYDINRPVDEQGDILWHKGRGLYFFNHDINQPLPKDVVFTIDMSSSTAFDWQHEMDKALPIMLDKLQPTDRFNILMYSKDVSEWKKDLQYATNENKASAIQFVKSFTPFEVGNIALALNKSLDHLNDPRPGRFQAVYFLCDGFDPNKRPNKIVKEVQHINKGRNIPIFTLALGPTADVTLLRTVAASTGAKFIKIYEAQLSDAVDMMVGFFGEINVNLLNNLTLINCDKAAHRFDRSRDYYRGSEIMFYITSNCFRDNSNPQILVTGTGHNGVNNYSTPIPKSDLGLRNDQQREDFLKSYLDFLTIKTAIYLNDIKTLRDYQGLILTRRSFIAIVPTSGNINTPGRVDVSEIWTQNIQGAGVGDPHFMVELKGLKRPVCFNMMGKPGDVVNLLYDKRNGILVNAKIICAEENDDCQKTYMGIISVSAPSENWTISPEGVEVNRHHTWQDESGGQLRDQFTVHYTDRRSMYMTWKSKDEKTIKLLIRRSETKNKASGTKYLDFYLVDGSGLSNATDGLIGQFTDRRGVVFKVRMLKNGKMKTDIRIHYQNHYRTFSAVLTAKRRSIQLRRDCWTVWNEGKGLVRGKYQDYVTQGLFEVPIFKRHL